MRFAPFAARAALAALCAFVVTGGSLGCAEERPPINRVQADALAKSFFVGQIDDPSDDPEFYMRTTVVDVDSGAGSDGLFTSSDSQPTVRIRWEITEKLLVARLTYERIQDTDHKGAARRTLDGQVVAAYTIEKHFDIKRDYNPTTGEELNVIVENDTDQPWYERQYMRVDWSRNLITDGYELDTLSQLGLYGAITWDTADANWVNDPTNPNHPVFDADNGYFDVTVRAYASPQIIHDPEWGDYPACWLYGSFPVVNCNTSEVTLRQSYRRVVDTDYEPLDYDGVRMDMFGYFTNDRYGYDRRYGVVDDKWHRFASRWNIFDKSHADPMVQCNTPTTTPVGASPHRDDDKDGTEDECASVGRGSRCDEFRGECTIPMRDRKIKTIPWHVNPGFPDELFDGTAKALAGWNDAVRVAVLAGRLAECRRTGEQGCEATMGWPTRWADDFTPPVGNASPDQVPNVFVLCHNPVDSSKGDDPACGPNGTAARLGDLRYNFVSVIQDPQQTSPWGIMVDAEDPLTGEKISGSVNEWGAVLDRAASTLVDLLELLNGNIAPDQYIKGQNVSEWVAANRPGGKADHPTPMSARELSSRQSAVDSKVIAGYLAGIATNAKPGEPAAIRHKQRATALSDAGRLGPGNAELSARLAALRGTPIEAAMIAPEMAQAAGFDPTAPLSSDEIKRASPFGRMNPSMRRSIERAKNLGRAARHSCRIDEDDVEPDNLIGLAKVAAQLFPAPDPNDPASVNDHRNKVYLWARQQYNQGVLAHEMGHSMGLRHNFAGSFDSLNYRAQYWQLRTKNGTVTQQCAAGTTDGSTCVGPRYKDPISQEEVDGNIGRYSMTTVMDYPGDQNQDQELQGKYDKAAVRFGYGNVVDVWAGDGLSTNKGSAKQADAYKLTAFTSYPGLFGVFWFPASANVSKDGYAFLHYSQYQKQFGLIGSCQADSSPDSVLGTKCQEHEMDVVDFRDMSDFAPDPDYAAFDWGLNRKAVDAQGRVRRGYMFSSDEFADVGNVPTFRNDAGADAYEQVRFLEQAYEHRYIVDAFRRNRTTFNSEAVIERIQARYLDEIQLISKTFAFGAVLDGDPTKPSAGLLDDGNYGPLEVGSTVALDLFARMMTRPEPGWYCPAGTCGGAQPYGVEGPVENADTAPLPDKYIYDFHVPLGDGRYVHNDYDYSQGYWWSDYQTQVGAYYEKIWATYYLSEAFDEFIANSKEDFTDSRYKNVNFATVFPEQVRRLFSNTFTNDLTSFAPWTTVPSNPSDTPEAALTYPTWHDLTGLGARPAGALTPDPNWAWNEQIYGMVFASIFFPTNWSTAWIHDARITALPSEQPDWPSNETYTFYYPPTGMTYRAHSIGAEDILGQTHERGVGARMLEWANKLLAVAYIVETDSQGHVLTNGDGTPMLRLDEQGSPMLNTSNPGADATLQKFVDQIDLLRQLTATFQQPLLNGGLPQP